MRFHWPRSTVRPPLHRFVREAYSYWISSRENHSKRISTKALPWPFSAALRKIDMALPVAPTVRSITPSLPLNAGDEGHLPQPADLRSGRGKVQ